MSRNLREREREREREGENFIQVNEHNFIRRLTCEKRLILPGYGYTIHTSRSLLSYEYE